MFELIHPQRRPRLLGVDVSKPYRTGDVLLEHGHEAPSLRAVAARAHVSIGEAEELAAFCRAVGEGGDPTSASLARNLRRHADAYLAAPVHSRLHGRDTLMARTLLEHLPDRGNTVLRARNEHLARNPEGWGGPTMGHVLADSLGARHHPVGVLCGGGERRAVLGLLGARPPVRERSGYREHACLRWVHGTSLGEQRP